MQDTNISVTGLRVPPRHPNKVRRGLECAKFKAAYLEAYPETQGQVAGGFAHRRIKGAQPRLRTAVEMIATEHGCSHSTVSKWIRQAELLCPEARIQLQKEDVPERVLRAFGGRNPAEQVSLLRQMNGLDDDDRSKFFATLLKTSPPPAAVHSDGDRRSGAKALEEAAVTIITLAEPGLLDGEEPDADVVETFASFGEVARCIEEFRARFCGNEEPTTVSPPHYVAAGTDQRAVDQLTEQEN